MEKSKTFYVNGDSIVATFNPDVLNLSDVKDNNIEYLSSVIVGIHLSLVPHVPIHKLPQDTQNEILSWVELIIIGHITDKDLWEELIVCCFNRAHVLQYYEWYGGDVTGYSEEELLRMFNEDFSERDFANIWHEVDNELDKELDEKNIHLDYNGWYKEWNGGRYRGKLVHYNHKLKKSSRMAKTIEECFHKKIVALQKNFAERLQNEL